MATNALQVEQTIGQIQPAHPQTFAPRTLQEAFTFANMVIESGFLPKAYVGKPPSAIVVALHSAEHTYAVGIKQPTVRLGQVSK